MSAALPTGRIIFFDWTDYRLNFRTSRRPPLPPGSVVPMRHLDDLLARARHAPFLRRRQLRRRRHARSPEERHLCPARRGDGCRPRPGGHRVQPGLARFHRQPDSRRTGRKGRRGTHRRGCDPGARPPWGERARATPRIHALRPTRLRLGPVLRSAGLFSAAVPGERAHGPGPGLAAVPAGRGRAAGISGPVACRPVACGPAAGRPAARGSRPATGAGRPGPILAAGFTARPCAFRSWKGQGERPRKDPRKEPWQADPDGARRPDRTD
jgi:hypothetical protein